MKAYLMENEIRFVKDDDIGYDSQYLVEEREFTNDELKYPTVLNGKIIVDEIRKSNELLNLVYQNKLNEIKRERDSMIKNGKFISESISGFEIDCRRDGINNDIQNIQALIDGMIATNQTSVNYSGTTSKKILTLAELQTLYIEMVQYGLSHYEKKHKKDDDINVIYNDTNLTIQEKIMAIEAIVW